MSPETSPERVPIFVSTTARRRPVTRLSHAVAALLSVVLRRGR